ncbi:50S ribosomal protein L35 [Alkalibacillus haloalkaliphilus]|uniref:50S ribosomal protein L35 n=1 Tax=Alkalibacillus haloalkaliphilus TaxID=94136 RepID=UPI0029353511|nr:50S ribosomal protein L35 [Alkalibacillus haloalkaliphilus]MDV2581180.1 50S ribosomal protein L35 [Alkalibacillus haloalkaliphilus]
MPKMKTHKSSQKRFKKTGTGKFKRSHAFTSHLFRNKTKAQKRRLAKSNLVAKSDENRLNKLMPYK